MGCRGVGSGTRQREGRTTARGGGFEWFSCSGTVAEIGRSCSFFRRFACVVVTRALLPSFRLFRFVSPRFVSSRPVGTGLVLLLSTGSSCHRRWRLTRRSVLPLVARFMRRPSPSFRFHCKTVRRASGRVHLRQPRFIPPRNTNRKKTDLTRVLCPDGFVLSLFCH